MTVFDICIKVCVCLFLLLLLSVCTVVVVVALREVYDQHMKKKGK